MKFTKQTATLILTVAAALGCDDTSRAMLTAPSPPAQSTPAAPEDRPSLHAMAGQVADAAWRPLSGALVEIVDGPDAGRSTITNAKGEFGFSGSFDESTHVRASKDGHVSATRPLNPFCERCNPNWWVFFNLESLATTMNLAGDYTVTFLADRACVGLPQEARTRTYEAVVSLYSPEGGPANSLFRVALTGAKFTEHYSAFDIGVAGDYLRAELGDAHGGAGIVEEIAANSYLLFAGGFEPSATDRSTIAGALVGTVDSCTSTSELRVGDRCTAGGGVTHVQCRSSNHRLIMQRR